MKNKLEVPKLSSLSTPFGGGNFSKALGKTMSFGHTINKEHGINPNQTDEEKVLSHVDHHVQVLENFYKHKRINKPTKIELIETLLLIPKMYEMYRRFFIEHERDANIGEYYDTKQILESRVITIGRMDKVPSDFLKSYIVLLKFALKNPPKNKPILEERTQDEKDEEARSNKEYQKQKDIFESTYKKDALQFVLEKGLYSGPLFDSLYAEIVGNFFHDEQIIPEGGEMQRMTFFENIKTNLDYFNSAGNSYFEFFILEHVEEDNFFAQIVLTTEEKDSITNLCLSQFENVGGKKHLLKSSKMLKTFKKEFTKEYSNLAMRHVFEYVLMSPSHLPYMVQKDSYKKDVAAIAILTSEMEKAVSVSGVQQLFYNFVYQKTLKIFEAVHQDRTIRAKKNASEGSIKTHSDDVQLLIEEDKPVIVVPEGVMQIVDELTDLLECDSRKSSDIRSFLLRVRKKKKPFHLLRWLDKSGKKISKEHESYFFDVAKNLQRRIYDAPIEDENANNNEEDVGREDDDNEWITTPEKEKLLALPIGEEERLTYEKFEEIITFCGLEIACTKSGLKKGYKYSLENQINRHYFLNRMKKNQRETRGKYNALRISKDFRLVKRYHYVIGIMNHNQYERLFPEFFSKK